ncbi:unnamed protein product [Anisakis simplex]|uniref:Putative nachr subunit (inferred by orthology to a S. mansoni protein) n=1 Tax=Anisakis simplex TaxID=6269 RepID=A0A0M3K4W6_ANISI|nr:unnamed protein product [Anisakis simplex]
MGGVWSPHSNHRLRESNNDDAQQMLNYCAVLNHSQINGDDDSMTFRVNDEQRLFKYILRDYDVSVRPVVKASSVVNVYMGLTLTHIFNIDERSQVLTMNIWVEQNWNDERIRWNPLDFGNISKLTVGIRYVWTPDIVLYNNAHDFSRGFVDTNLHIRSNGDSDSYYLSCKSELQSHLLYTFNNLKSFLAVQWAPPAKVYSICKLDVTFFPFDDQFCLLEFGSWIYDRSQLDVQIMQRYDGKDPFTRDSFTENGEWEIVANRTRRLLRGRHSVFPTVVFELHLRRRMLYFMYNIIAPCVMLSILTMMQFMLPCESGEKVTLGLTVLLAYSVFSFNIAENMPETSEVIPLIAIYIMCIMGISALSVCLSVAVLNMRHGAERNCRVPRWLNFIAYRLLGRLFGIKEPSTERKPSLIDTRDRLTMALMKRLENGQFIDDQIQRWSQISTIFDRFFFLCVFVLTFVTSVPLLLLAPRFSHRSFDNASLNNNLTH